jgi:hypothetical protein
MFPSNKVLGCTRHLLATQSGFRSTHGAATLFRTQRMLTQTTLYRPRPKITRIQPLVLGGIRQHGSHGHHHDADLMNSLKSSSK